ncbi:unnamed protein product [Cutaneotrichosporon oleaginosum]
MREIEPSVIIKGREEGGGPKDPRTRSVAGIPTSVSFQNGLLALHPYSLSSLSRTPLAPRLVASHSSSLVVVVGVVGVLILFSSSSSSSPLHSTPLHSAPLYSAPPLSPTLPPPLPPHTTLRTFHPSSKIISPLPINPVSPSTHQPSTTASASKRHEKRHRRTVLHVPGVQPIRVLWPRHALDTPPQRLFAFAFALALTQPLPSPLFSILLRQLRPSPSAPSSNPPTLSLSTDPACLRSVSRESRLVSTHHLCLDLFYYLACACAAAWMVGREASMITDASEGGRGEEERQG